MSFTRSTLAILLSSACFSIGCASVDVADVGDEESVGEAEGAIVNPNALNPNALNPNALNPNALNPNALNPNALNPNALNPNSIAPSALSSLQDPGAAGDVSRQLFKYMIGCGLDGTQSYSLTWYDLDGVRHDETYVGYLGLAKDWPDRPLSPSEQEWISACLLSRTNWYGTSVMLSSRAQQVNLKVTEPNELNDYPNFEGAFWGNIFADTPVAFACNNAPTMALARTAHRDCAAGHENLDGTTSNCGIIQIVGDCASHCSEPDPSDGYYPSCGLTLNGTDKTHRVISVFLP